MKQNEKSSQNEIKEEKSWDEILKQLDKPRFVPDKGTWGLSLTEQQKHRRSKD